MNPRLRTVAAGAALVLLSVSACGCGEKDSKTCGAVSGHVISLVRAELAKDGDVERVKQARANLPTLQNALLNACESQKWSPRVRACIARAQTTAETRECDPSLQTPPAENAAPQDQSR